MNKDMLNPDEMPGVVILNAALAKKLLRLGYTIIDLKPLREDRTKTVFVFLEEHGIRDYF